MVERAISEPNLYSTIPDFDSLLIGLKARVKLPWLTLKNCFPKYVIIIGILYQIYLQKESKKFKQNTIYTV